MARIRLFEIGTGEVPDRGVTGAVEEPTAMHPEAFRGPDVLADHGMNTTIHDVDFIHALFEEQGDAWFRSCQRQLAVVIEDRSRLRIVRIRPAVGHEFHDHVSDARPGRLIHVSLWPDPYLRAGVATKHRSILDQCDIEAESGGGDSRTGACHAATDDDQVETSTILRFIRQPKNITPEGSELIDVIRRLKLEVACQQNGITPPLETREVMECQLGRAGQIDRTAILPVPLRTLRAEGGCKRCSIDEQLESPRRARRAPWSDPVTRSHPDTIRPRQWSLDRGTCVLDRSSHPMRQEKR